MSQCETDARLDNSRELAEVSVIFRVLETPFEQNRGHVQCMRLKFRLVKNYTKLSNGIFKESYVEFKSVPNFENCYPFIVITERAWAPSERSSCCLCTVFPS